MATNLRPCWTWNGPTPWLREPHCVFYLGNDSTASPNGAIVDAIQRAVNDNKCGVISVSFGLCGGDATFYTKP